MNKTNTQNSVHNCFCSIK